MNTTELIQKIRAEIDKRYSEYRAKMKTDDFTYYEGMADALDLFEQFIDTLESEKPMNQDELKKEIENQLAIFPYTKVSPELPESRWIVIRKELYMFARHFAQWQKEQMMKGAVEGEVIKTDKHTSVRYKSFYGTDRYFYGIVDKQFKRGEKVRIIIVKEEGQ